MILEEELINIVTLEIAKICKFYDVDYSKLSLKEIDMFTEIFQAGVAFMERLEK